MSFSFVSRYFRSIALYAILSLFLLWPLSTYTICILHLFINISKSVHLKLSEILRSFNLFYGQGTWLNKSLHCDIKMIFKRILALTSFMLKLTRVKSCQDFFLLITNILLLQKKTRVLILQLNSANYLKIILYRNYFINLIFLQIRIE